MGMYTELNIAVTFKDEVPSEVVKVLSYMGREPSDKCDTPKLPEHPLFQTDRWSWMLRSGGSYYFSGKPHLTWVLDDIAKCWFLTLRTNIKNYTEEWEHFLDFIAPHIEDGYIGTYQYEEDAAPTLVWVNKGKVTFQTVEVPAELKERFG